MTFPFTPNVIVDIYRTFNKNDPMSVTRSNPDVPQVQGYLRQNVQAGRFGFHQSVFWTELLLLPLGTDVRSAYNSQLNSIDSTKADTIVIDDYPIQNVSTAFLAVMVQRAGRGSDADYLKVYLDKAGKSAIATCCESVPDQLHVTISDFFRCPCLNGIGFTITMNTQTGRWEGNFNACGNSNFFWLKCENPGGQALGYQIGIQCGNAQELVNPLVPTTDNHCDPFHLQFGLANPAQFGSCCTIDESTYFDITL